MPSLTFGNVPNVELKSTLNTSSKTTDETYLSPPLSGSRFKWTQGDALLVFILEATQTQRTFGN